MLSKLWVDGLPIPFSAIGDPLKILPRVMPRTSAAVPVTEAFILTQRDTPPIWGLAEGDASAGRFWGFIRPHHPRPFALEDWPFPFDGRSFHTPKTTAISIYYIYISFVLCNTTDQTRFKGCWALGRGNAAVGKQRSSKINNDTSLRLRFRLAVLFISINSGLDTRNGVFTIHSHIQD